MKTVREISNAIGGVALVATLSSGLIQAENKPTTQIEEVIVTASKRTENLRDIPATIAHFDGTKLEDQGKLNLADYLQETPGVVLNSSVPGYVRISIRGIGIDNSPSATLPSAVGILIGDTPFSDPYIAGITPDLSAFDLAGVEVLKGPQGTLFGGAALSGAVRYVLQDASLEGFEARGFSQYMDYEHGEDAVTSGIAANLPLYRDKMAIRLGYVKREYPGLYDNRRSGEKDINDAGGDQRRALLRWLPTDRLEVKVTYLDQDFAADDAVFLADNREDRSISYFLLRQPNTHDFSLKSLELRYDFDSFSVFSITSDIDKNSYAFSDISATFFAPRDNFTEEEGIFTIVNHNAKAISQELRFQSSGDWWVDWLVGIYDYDYDMHFDIYVNTVAQERVGGLLGPVSELALGNGRALGSEFSMLDAYNDAVATEQAIFLDLTKTLWDRLQISLGARYYETVVEGGYKGVGALARAANNGEAVDLYKKIVEKDINPRYAIKFDITDDLSVYAQSAKGFRFGGIQTIPPSEMEGVPATYKSDKLTNYELGFRSLWFDKTVQLDAVVFKIDYEDPQIQQQTETTRLGFKDNVGSAESSGFEVSLKWLTPIDGLTLAIDGGKVDAHTAEPFEDSSGNMIPSGTQMPGAADSQYSAALSYFGNAFDCNYGFYLSYNYIGKNYGDLAQTEAVNDFHTLNAGFSLSLERWRFKPQLAVNVTNINDVTAAIGGFSRVNTLGEKEALYTLNAPRTLSARLSFDF